MFSAKVPLLLTSLVLASTAGADVQRSSLTSAMPDRGLWTRTFTDLIRTDQPDHWGNWNLDTSITAGAIGYINTNTGEFERIGIVPNITTSKTDMSEVMKLSTEYVNTSQFNVNLSDKLPSKDSSAAPEIGTTVQWKFNKSGSIATQWSVSSHERVDNPINVMTENMTWLQSEAGKVNMYDTEHGVSQGFGMVTGVIWAKSGMNAGSLSDTASWSITGKSSNIDSMLGNGSGEASFLKTDSTGAISTHTWPASANSVSTTMVPIAYSFASMDGTTIIPSWIGMINSFQVILNNTKGSYIVDADLYYSTSNGEVHEQTQLSGGLTRTFGNIPLDANHLKLELKFIGMVNSDYYTIRWEKPLGHWLTGQRHVELHGYWPGPTSYTILEEQFADE